MGIQRELLVHFEWIIQKRLERTEGISDQDFLSQISICSAIVYGIRSGTPVLVSVVLNPIHRADVEKNFDWPCY